MTQDGAATENRRQLRSIRVVLQVRWLFPLALDAYSRASNIWPVMRLNALGQQPVLVAVVTCIALPTPVGLN